MAYIDLTKITDAHAKRIITKDADITADALANAEMDVRMVARSEGVLSADIPVEDVTGYLKSEALYVYCKWRFLFYLFSAVSGSADLEDIYRIKTEQAEHQSRLTQDRVNYYIITEDEVTTPEKRNVGIPIISSSYSGNCSQNYDSWDCY